MPRHLATRRGRSPDVLSEAPLTEVSVRVLCSKVQYNKQSLDKVFAFAVGRLSGPLVDDAGRSRTSVCDRERADLRLDDS